MPPPGGVSSLDPPIGGGPECGPPIGGGPECGPPIGGGPVWLLLILSPPMSTVGQSFLGFFL
jgi:hypothetical protein